jgi:hypothetical protein
MTAAACPFMLDIEAPANGRIGKSAIYVRDHDGRILHTDAANLMAAEERHRAAKRIAKALAVEVDTVSSMLDEAWNGIAEQQQQRQAKAANGSSDTAPIITTDLLDSQPAMIRRPLALVEGRGYATTWCKVRIRTTRSVNAAGDVTEHNPPLVKVDGRLVVVTDDGRYFADGGGIDGARPLGELGLPVSLPATPPPGREWSGAGVKRYIAGDRPAAAEVFARVVQAVDHFIDFERSLAPQSTMCELVACYIVATYFLDAFNVAGYLWPNGEPGAGKSTLLQVVTELAYLGQMVLAGSSYPTLRDLADYGATIGFDDAEAVMDVKRTDPDKRTLLLAGNRRGATIAVKELQGDKWVTRYVDAFAFRLFSGIRLPDQVLGSRTIIVPLVRSGDKDTTDRDPADPDAWPCDRRRLLDDLWALGLANLSVVRQYDAKAAKLARLSGRNLQPWRAIFAVARWLEECHGVKGLFDRMERLSMDYQAERNDYEDNDATRVLYRALLPLVHGRDFDEPVFIRPGELSEAMNKIAHLEELTKPDDPFTNSRKVGWILKKLRFQHRRDDCGKQWMVTRKLVESGALAHGIDVTQTPDVSSVG